MNLLKVVRNSQTQMPNKIRKWISAEYLVAKYNGLDYLLL